MHIGVNWIANVPCTKFEKRWFFRLDVGRGDIERLGKNYNRFPMNGSKTPAFINIIEVNIFLSFILYSTQFLRGNSNTNTCTKFIEHTMYTYAHTTYSQEPSPTETTGCWADMCRKRPHTHIRTATPNMWIHWYNLTQTHGGKFETLAYMPGTAEAYTHSRPVCIGIPNTVPMYVCFSGARSHAGTLSAGVTTKIRSHIIYTRSTAAVVSLLKDIFFRMPVRIISMT